MIRLLKCIPIVLSVIGVVRRARKDAAAKNTRPVRKRRSTFRK